MDAHVVAQLGEGGRSGSRESEGFFFRARDPKALACWYSDRLGVSFVLKPFGPEEIVGALLDALALQFGAVEAAREESRRVIAELLGLLGYSEDWAVELEAKSFRAGKVWRVAG